MLNSNKVVMAVATDEVALPLGIIEGIEDLRRVAKVSQATAYRIMKHIEEHGGYRDINKGIEFITVDLSIDIDKLVESIQAMQVDAINIVKGGLWLDLWQVFRGDENEFYKFIINRIQDGKRGGMYLTRIAEDVEEYFTIEDDMTLKFHHHETIEN